MKKKMRMLAVLIVAGAALFATVGSGSETSSDGPSKSSDTGDDATGGGNGTSGEADEVADVTITSCEVDPDLKWPSAGLTIKNGSSKASDYMIEVTFESKDGSVNYGTGSSFVQNLAPGQTKNDKAQGIDEAQGEIVCKVTSVDRTASV